MFVDDDDTNGEIGDDDVDDTDVVVVGVVDGAVGVGVTVKAIGISLTVFINGSRHSIQRSSRFEQSKQICV